VLYAGALYYGKSDVTGNYVCDRGLDFISVHIYDTAFNDNYNTGSTHFRTNSHVHG